MAVFTLDTSAVLAVLNREREHEKVAGLLRSARDGQDVRILLPFIAMMEVEYKLLRSPDLTESDVRHWLDVVLAWPAELIQSSPEWASVAARVKAKGRLSLADAWVAGLALQENAVLVHKDPEFEAVADLQHLRLQYDRDNRA